MLQLVATFGWTVQSTARQTPFENSQHHDLDCVVDDWSTDSPFTTDGLLTPEYSTEAEDALP